MQSVLRSSCCRVTSGALRRVACQAGSSGARPPLPPPAGQLRRTLSQHAGGLGGGAAPAQGSANRLAGMFQRLREQRFSFRTFSSGGGGGAGGGSSGGGGGGGGDGSSGGGGLWAAYLALLTKQPVATKALTAAVLNGLGDVIAQTQFEDGPIDLKRLGIFTFLGLVLIGPALHVWYGSLGSLVTATGNTGAFLRLALDQLCFAPVFISVIVGSIMALEGKGGEVPTRLKRDLPDMIKSNWMLWVPFQFINFRFVPQQLQVLMSNVVALAWNTYMSYKSHAA